MKIYRRGNIEGRTFKVNIHLKAIHLKDKDLKEIEIKYNLNHSALKAGDEKVRFISHACGDLCPL